MGFERTIRPKSSPALPAQGLRAARPFGSSIPEPPRQAPSFEAQERAAAFGHNFGRLPAAPAVVQLCRTKGTKRKKPAKKPAEEKVPEQQRITSFFRQPAPAPSDSAEFRGKVRRKHSSGDVSGAPEPAPALPGPLAPSLAPPPSPSPFVPPQPSPFPPSHAPALPSASSSTAPARPLASIFKSPQEQKEDRDRHFEEEARRARERERVQAQREKEQALAEARNYPQLANVPDDWVAGPAHNPDGPPVRLQPPQRHPGPSRESRAQSSESAHIFDLSTGRFNVYQGPEKPPLVYDIDREDADGDETRSDVRHYAALSNEHLRHKGPLVPQATHRRESDSLGSRATAISSKERRQHKSAYGSKVVAHVPDSSVSGVPYSPLGFLPLTPDANTIVGYASGIGLRAAQKKAISHFLVREQGDEGPELHHYQLPERKQNADDGPSTSSSSSSSQAPALLPPPPTPALPPQPSLLASSSSSRGPFLPPAPPLHSLPVAREKSSARSPASSPPPTPSVEQKPDDPDEES